MSAKFCQWRIFVFLFAATFATSMPLGPPEIRSSLQNKESGFAASPKILEIQLPLKIATKEDLIAWAKYVMSLMASKIDITLSAIRGNSSKTPERTRNAFAQNVPHSLVTNGNLRETNSPRFKATKSGNAFDQSNANQDNSFLPRYPNFGTGNTYNINDIEVLSVTYPTVTYLPIPVKTEEPDDDLKFRQQQLVEKYYYDGAQRNVSAHFEEKSLKNGMGGSSDFKLDDLSPGKSEKPTIQRNLSAITPFLTVPFEAVITITKEQPAESAVFKNDSVEYFVLPKRDPPDEFPPYFEKNYTFVNKAGHISVVLDEEKAKDKEEKEEVKKETPKKEPSKKKKQEKTEESKKREPPMIELLRKVLDALRRPSGNETESPLASPLLNILKERTSRKMKTAAQKATRINPMGGGSNETTEGSPQLEEQSQDYEDGGGGEGGGSLQAFLDLLPLAAPLLEDLSDPNSDTDLSEVLQAAIPLLQGLSEPDEDGEAVDLPGVIVPILTSLSGGKDGRGSDAAAVIGPLIQLLAPLIGPILGPLIGPLSRSSNRPYGEGGSSISALVQAVAWPLSEPTGPGKTSPFSNLVAGIIASLSNELKKGGLDYTQLISMLVAGAVSGVTFGLSGASKEGFKVVTNGHNGYKDSVYSPTGYGANYGGYGSYAVPAKDVKPSTLIVSSIKDIVGSGLQIASTLVKGVAKIFASSSAEPSPTYGPPSDYGTTTYSKPTYYSKPGYATASYTRPSYAPPQTTVAPYKNKYNSYTTGIRPPPPERTSTIRKRVL